VISLRVASPAARRGCVLAVGLGCAAAIAIVLSSGTQARSTSVPTPTTNYGVFATAPTAADVIPATNPLSAAVARDVPGAEVRAMPTTIPGLSTWAVAGAGEICVAADNGSGPEMACDAAARLTTDPNELIVSATNAATGAGSINTSTAVGAADLIVGLAPDGVTAVTTHYENGATATVPVVNNGFQLAANSTTTITSYSWTDQAGAPHSEENG
jgi:hypothetical protein